MTGSNSLVKNTVAGEVWWQDLFLFAKKKNSLNIFVRKQNTLKYFCWCGVGVDKYGVGVADGNIMKNRVTVKEEINDGKERELSGECTKP